MDELIQNEDMETRPFTGLSARLPALNNFLECLVMLFNPTQEEQHNAGVYLGGEGRE